ncbi:MAG: hypothetical protein F4X65_12895 [Chloroflexi bacterium]|nr:hypothetical protein [Chloroflexota bacterium]
MAPPWVDGSPRQCRICYQKFSVVDYPRGYLRRAQLRYTRNVSICPTCQVGRIRKEIKEIQERGLNSPEDRRQVLEYQQDVDLLLTGRIVCPRHRDNSKNAYGY